MRDVGIPRGATVNADASDELILAAYLYVRQRLNAGASSSPPFLVVSFT